MGDALPQSEGQSVPHAPLQLGLSYERGAIIGRVRCRAEELNRLFLFLDGELLGPGRALATGPGQYELSWLVAARFYDGETHQVSVRLGHHSEDIESLAIAFSEKYRPEIKAAVRLRPDGALVGYAHNAKWQRKRLELELWVGARVTATARCDQANPSFAPEDVPDRRGFVIEPPANAALWLSQPVRVVIPELGEVLTTDPHFLATNLRIEAVALDDDALTATVVCPPAFQQAGLEVFLDGARTSYVQRVLSGMLVIKVLEVQPSARPGVVLSIRTAAGAEILGSPVPVSRTPGRGVRNGRFERWSGPKPSFWDVTDGVSVLPINVEGGGSAIVLQAPEGEGGPWPLLSQRIDLGTSNPLLHLKVRARAPGGAVLIVGLSGKDGRAAQSLVPVGGGWAEYNLSVALPEVHEQQCGRLEIGLSETAFRRIDIAQVEFVGPEHVLDESSGDESVDAIAPARRAWNAVRGGALAKWSNGFEFEATNRRQELADGWFSEARTASPSARVRLGRILVPPSGQASAATLYGLEISGPLLVGGMLVDTALDHAELSQGLARCLSFTVARPPTTSGQHTGQPSGIRRIRILKRGAKGDTEVIATIANRIAVGRTARRHRLEVSRATAELIAQGAGRPEEEAGALFLTFEFDAGPTDVVIADVWFGDDAQPEKQAETANQDAGEPYLAVEDPTIAAQLGRLKGIEQWASPVPILPVPAPSSAPSLAWSWSHNAATVDVVVPVHNALIEVEACLESLERRTGRPHRVIVVNDLSNVSTTNFLRAYAAPRPWVSLIENTENLGYTRAANIGLKASDAEWVVLLNSDTVVPERWLDGLLECASSDPETALIGPVSNAASWQSVPEIRDARGGWMVNRLEEGMSVDQMGQLVRNSSLRSFPEVPLLNGFCTLMKREVIEAVGLLDEQAFPVGYGEENDLCIRVRKAGHRIRIADHVYVYHVKSASFGSSRSVLAKQGARACAAKHPDISLDQLTQVMADCGPLIQLRASLKQTLHQVPEASER